MKELHLWRKWSLETRLNCGSRSLGLRATSIFFMLIVIPLLGCTVRKNVAEQEYQRALTLVDLGTTKLRELDWNSAEAAFSLAEEVAPLAAAIDGQGCVAMMRGDFEKAEQLFRDAYEIDETYDEALANLALLYDLSGEQERARELYESFLAKHPDSQAVRNNYAATLDDLRSDRAKVIHELLKARALQSNGIVEENITQVVHRGREHDKEIN